LARRAAAEEREVMAPYRRVAAIDQAAKWRRGFDDASKLALASPTA
jgi:hypothetical protein